MEIVIPSKLVSPPLNTLTFVATNSADTISGSNRVFEFVIRDAQTPDQELCSVVDPNYRQMIAGNPRDLFGHFPSDTSAIFFAVFDDFTVDYSFSPSRRQNRFGLTTQHGGFAEGDQLINVLVSLDRLQRYVIRGSDLIPPRTSRHKTYSMILVPIRCLVAAATILSKAVAASIP